MIFPWDTGRLMAVFDSTVRFKGQSGKEHVWYRIGILTDFIVNVPILGKNIGGLRLSF